MATPAAVPILKEKTIKKKTQKTIHKSGISAGLRRGHVVTKRQRRARPVSTKGKLTKRTKFVREVIREVSGYAPYERRIIELLKVGLEKRALRLAKRKIGTHRRGIRKREELLGIVNAAKFAA
eukprot:TRINITY_DN3735_c0_g1_i1.p1 TRINITY_DN3735_c0_g1~~TRINITY_DN3735_c0_g1_i1.p1  ORF type:complete len:123 (+),score=39.34 TRINITY_DN3735_c0_g1_i1:94-462(+)